MAASARGNIKGIAIASIVRGLRAKREQAERVLPVHLRHYLEHRVAVTAWHPEVDYLALMQALMRVQESRNWEAVGVIAANESLTSVYRNIVVAGDVPETARRMRINWRNYHDTGELAVENEPRLVRVIVTGYCMSSLELCRLNQGYFRQLLALSGALVTEERKAACTSRGDPRCVWEFVWDQVEPAR